MGSDIIAPEAWRTPWSTRVLTFDRFTGDRRWFSPGSLTSRNTPIPLLLQIQTADGHKGSVVVGAADDVNFNDAQVTAQGTWLDPDKVPEVNRALALMEAGIATVSADLEPDMIVTVEEATDGGRPYIYYERAKICGITIVPIPAFDQPGLHPYFGEPVPAEDPVASLALTGTTSWRNLPAQPRELKYNADQAFKNILAWADGNDAKARALFLWYDPTAAQGTRDRFRLPIGDVVEGRPALNFHAVYAAAALVSGAHGGLPTVSDQEKARLRRVISEIYARLAGLYGDPGLTAPWDERAKLPDVKASSLEAVAASAAPVAPPDEWFTDPKLPGPTPSPIITPDGRFMVHLATHNSCHRAIQQATGQCFTPPPSPSGYRRFMDGSVVTASGRTVPVGRVTVGGAHPSLGLDASAARRHYDDIGACAAIVAAGEDDFGIWLSGALVPEATPEQVAMLRRHPISGDWRRHGSEGLDLVAALSVNVAGFPAPYRGAVRTLSVNDGECQALVASAAEGEVDVNEGTDAVTTGGDSAVAPEPSTPMVDVDAIVAQAAERAVATIADTTQRQERLATLFAMDEMAREARLVDLQPIAALAITAEQRQQAFKRGDAMPPKEGGEPRYPIRNEADLEKAIRAVGRGSGNHDEIRRWIMKRARELKRIDMIPGNWNSDGSVNDRSRGNAGGKGYPRGV